MPQTAEHQNVRQNSYRKASSALSSAPARCFGAKRTLALSMLVGGLSALLAPMGHAQAAPQTLPYINTIVAGTAGTTYTPATATGSTSTAVHGGTAGDGTIAEGGSGVATSAPLAQPTHIAVDSLGDIYITDQTSYIRKIDTSGNITDFAGGIAVGTGGHGICPTATGLGITLGDGCPADEAYLSTPYGIAIDPASGDIYISENKSGSYRIRKISHSTYTILSVVDEAGTKTASAATANGDLQTCAAPQTCSGTFGNLNGPRGLAVDKHGNLYIMDEGNFAVRLANFSTGQLTTVVNTAMVKATTTATTGTCFTNATIANAGLASLGVAGAIAFDSNDNLYIADATCNYVFKVAEDPSTKMVDSGSTISVVLGDGPAGAAQTTYTNQLGTTVTITPGGIVADPQGNLYVGENTGNHVWFWDHATGYMHTIYSGGTAGSCFGVAASGTSPYNNCDGTHAGLAATAGTLGLALDAWGNLYITDVKGFVVHKLSLGTNAPVAAPAGNPNALLHFGANDTYASIATTLAPDFTFAQQSCTVNLSSNTPAGDNTQDCGYIATNTNTSTNAQYEQVTVTSTAGKSAVVPLTNQAYPVCQPAVAANKSAVIYSGSASVTLSYQAGLGCTGVETVALAPHNYSYAIATSPTHGTLSGTAPALTYTPTGTAVSDSFTYTVTDANTFTAGTITYDSGASTVVMETPTPLASNTATVTLNPYVAPTATPQSVTVTYNTGKAITLTGTDSNGATLTYAIASGATHGTLSGTAPNVTYTPTSGYFGTDSFTFTVNDGVSTSTAGTVSITVNPPPPVPVNQNVSVNYQTATSIPTLSATGSGTITYAVATQPAHGTVTGTAPGSLVYTPGSTYSGTDLFTFTATNAGGSTVGTVNITVGTPPALPVAQPESVTVVNATATPITAIAGGGTGTLTYTVVTGPTNGTLSVGGFTGATITYTPTGTYSGNDSFTYKVTDSSSHVSNTATISIFVTLAPPVANSQSLTTPFNTPLTITLVATGPGTLVYSEVTQPTHGTLTGTAPGPLTYTPTTNYVGADSFTFRANNGANSNTATISINVSAPPVPTVANSSVTVVNATAKTFTVTASGLGTLTYTITVPTTNGTVTGTGPNYTYTPTGTYYGPDSLTFTVTNQGGTSSPATVSFTVLPVPPVAQPQTVTVPNNSGTPVVSTPITLVATGNGTLTYSAVTQPGHGTVSVSAAGIATYTPTAGYAGADSFTFQANNGTNSNAATVTITVLPAIPVAANFSITAYFNTALTITSPTYLTANVTYNILSGPSHGTLVLTGNGTANISATYTPTTNYAGSDSITYTETNAGGTSNVGTISITVVGGFVWAVAPGGSFSATVTNGQVATYNLQLYGWTGATDPVSFMCMGAPFLCTFTPQPGTLTGTTPIPVTVTITTLTTSPAPLGLSWTSGSGKYGRWLLMLNLAWLALIVPLARKRNLICRVAIAFLTVTMIAGMSGCGRNIPEQQFGSPAGNYTYTIVATDGALPQTEYNPPCIVPAVAATTTTPAIPAMPVTYACAPQTITLTIQ